MVQNTCYFDLLSSYSGMETREINLSVSQGTGTEMGTGMVNGSHALLFHWGKTLSSF